MSLLTDAQSQNLYGSVHGGWIMRQIDQAAYVCATRHAGQPTVTASVDKIDFRSPIRVGDVVTLRAAVHYVGKTSMVIGVKVEAEDPLTGEMHHSNSSLLTFVAIDRDHRPVTVPGLIRETPEEEARWEAAKVRREAESRLGH